MKAVETRRSASEMGGGIQRRGRERGRGGERKEEKEKGDEGSSRQAGEREREREGEGEDGDGEEGQSVESRFESHGVVVLCASDG